MKPTPREIAALRARYSPVTPVKLFQVVLSGAVVFENVSYALCDHYIKTNSLNCKPTLKR